MPLPAQLQGKYQYSVARWNDGAAEVLHQSTNQTAERFVVSADRQTLTIYANRFSLYAIGYSDYVVTGNVVHLPDETSNGTVSANAMFAAPGTKVIITAAPDEGYRVESITVIDSSGKEVAVTPKEDGTYEFTMP